MPSNLSLPRFSILLFGFFLLARIPAIAEPVQEPASGWPQWGGPERSWHSGSLAQLADTWPEDGPRVVWRRPLGDGYSSIVVAEQRLATLYRRAGEEIAIAIDPSDGTTIWEHGWPQAPVENRFGPGPYPSPAIHGDLVVFVGSGAKVRAFRLESGEPLWQRDLRRELGGDDVGDFGFSASPLVVAGRQPAEHDLVILPLGGRGRGVVALELETGALAWSRGDDQAGFSSPTLIEAGGREQVVVVSKAEINGLDPRSGEALWRIDHANPNGANVLTPIFADGLLYVSSGPAKGSRGLAVDPLRTGSLCRDQPLTGSCISEPTERWASSQLRVFYTNAVVVGDRVIGSNGGVGSAHLTAARLADGEIVWRSREIGRANLVVAGDKILALQDDGWLFLLRLLPKGPRILASHRLFGERSWTPPTLVENHLYARDREEVVALELP